MAATTSDPDWLPPGWPEGWRGCLSDDTLEQASSAVIFGRGRSYARGGQVRVSGEDPLPEPALRARVTGSEIYTTEVWIEGDAIAGECSCPHAEEGWFCKHQVALALVWRERLASGQSTAAAGADNPAAPRTATERAQSLYDFLHGQDSATLADKLLALAERDADLALELHQWRELSAARHDISHLQAVLTDILTPAGGYLEYGEDIAYADHAQAALPVLQELRADDPAAAVDLCVHALRLSWQALQHADDSEGEIGSWCAALGAELEQAIAAAGDQPAAFGETLLQLQMDDPFGCFDSDAIAAAIGPAALERYRLTLARRWRSAKDTARTRSTRDDDKTGGYYAAPLWTLERLHLGQLKQTGDVDGVLAVLRDDLSRPDHCNALVKYLEEIGRFDAALAEAERASSQFPDDWSLEQALLRGLERVGRHQDVLALRRARFERHPDLKSYQDVLQAGRAAGIDTTRLRQELLDQLQACETEAFARQHAEAKARAARPRQPWQVNVVAAPTGPDVSLRAEILGAEGLWAQALALVQPPAVCSERMLKEISQHLPRKQDAAAVALLLRVFDAVMPRSSSPYEEALALVRLILPRMTPERRTVWLAQLRVQYKAKRNFMRDLPSG